MTQSLLHQTSPWVLLQNVLQKASIIPADELLQSTHVCPFLFRRSTRVCPFVMSGPNAFFLFLRANSLTTEFDACLCLCQERSIYTCLPLLSTVSTDLSASVNNSQYMLVCLCQQQSVYTCLPLSSTVSIYLSASVNSQYIPVCLCQQSVYTCLPLSTTVSIYSLPVCLCQQRSAYTCLPMSTKVSIYLSASVINGQYIPVCLCRRRSVYTCLPLSSTVGIYLSASVINGQ